MRKRLHDSQVVHLNKLIQEKLHAIQRATYSTVKRATRLVSSPNQMLVGIEWKAGTVSRTVTRAESRIRNVVSIWMTNAEGDEVGCSKRAFRFRFQAGCILARSFLYEADVGIASLLLSPGESGGSWSSLRKCEGSGCRIRAISILMAVAIMRAPCEDKGEWWLSDRRSRCHHDCDIAKFDSNERWVSTSASDGKLSRSKIMACRFW